MKKRKCLRPCILILTGILLLQLLLLVYFGYQKLGFHEDEMATYTLSNYPDGFICRTESLIHHWVNGSEFMDVLTVSGEERFDYQMVYENQESDVHPPLYYYLIHTLSSLCEGKFSKWIGLFPNIVFCLLTSILLFCISRRLMQSEFLAVLVTAVWAFSTGAVDVATFLRMYAMFTMLVVLFVFLHVRVFAQIIEGQKLSAKQAVFLFLTTLAGLLTHYYFSVYALFWCGIFMLYLLLARKWRDALAYLLAEFGAIGAAVLHFPAMLNHIFGDGYRGVEAFHNLKSSSNFFAKYIEIFQIISRDTLSGLTLELFLLCLVLFGVAALGRIFMRFSIKHVDGILEFSFKRGRSTGELRVNKSASCVTLRIPANGSVICSIGIVFFLYSFLISKVAPFRSDRYYMCLYPLFILCAVWFVYQVLVFVFRGPKVCKTAAALLFLAISFFGLMNQNADYLYQESAKERETLKNHSDLPVIVLNGAYDWYPTSFLAEYSDHPEVYICAYQCDLSCLDEAAENTDLTNGFLLYALRFSQRDEEIINRVQQHLPLQNYQRICSGSDRVFLCTVAE